MSVNLMQGGHMLPWQNSLSPLEVIETELHSSPEESSTAKCGFMQVWGTCNEPDLGVYNPWICSPPPNNMGGILPSLITVLFRETEIQKG